MVRGLTGNFRRRLRRRLETSRFVVKTIKVQRRSRPESTREAIRESEEEYMAAIALAARRITLAITLICIESARTQMAKGVFRTLIAHFAFHSAFCLRSSSS